MLTMSLSSMTTIMLVRVRGSLIAVDPWDIVSITVSLGSMTIQVPSLSGEESYGQTSPTCLVLAQWESTKQLELEGRYKSSF